MKWFIGFTNKQTGNEDYVENRHYKTKRACQIECDELNKDGSGWEDYFHYPIKETELEIWTVRV